MTRFILALIRILALILSFLLSTLAASLFVTFALFLGGDPEWLKDDPLVMIGSVGFSVTLWWTIASVLFLPLCGLTIVSEFARLSSLTANLLLGGLSAVIFMVMHQTLYESDLPYDSAEIWLAALSAGFVGGFTHWMLAGHRAGRWLGPPVSSHPQSGH